MRNALKKEKGITLIALVITIIVLVILAGVSINLVLGDNGIINKVKNAAKEQERARCFEEIKLEIATEQIDRVNNVKEELFIVSLKNRIQQKRLVNRKERKKIQRIARIMHTRFPQNKKVQ